MSNNLLITGFPGCGKTTLVRRISNDPLFSSKIAGFYTEEIREKGKRVGFKVIDLPGHRESLLARKGLQSSARVNRYGVAVDAFENAVVPVIEEALQKETCILIDEIGKMELFSLRFQSVLSQALESSQKVLGTIMERENPVADRIKKRRDVRLLFLNRENFNRILDEIYRWLQNA